MFFSKLPQPQTNIPFKQAVTSSNFVSKSKLRYLFIGLGIIFLILALVFSMDKIGLGSIFIQTKNISSNFKNYNPFDGEGSELYPYTITYRDDQIRQFYRPKNLKIKKDLKNGELIMTWDNDNITPKPDDYVVAYYHKHWINLGPDEVFNLQAIDKDGSLSKSHKQIRLDIKDYIGKYSEVYLYLMVKVNYQDKYYKFFYGDEKKEAYEPIVYKL